MMFRARLRVCVCASSSSFRDGRRTSPVALRLVSPNDKLEVPPGVVYCLCLAEKLKTIVAKVEKLKMGRSGNSPASPRASVLTCWTVKSEVTGCTIEARYSGRQQTNHRRAGDTGRSLMTSGSCLNATGLRRLTSDSSEPL